MKPPEKKINLMPNSQNPKLPEILKLREKGTEVKLLMQACEILGNLGNHGTIHLKPLQFPKPLNPKPPHH